MGQLAELAGAKKLTGKVAVTSVTGITTVYEDEDEAESACGGMSLEHRRGAFFEAAAPAPEPAPVEEPAPEEPAPEEPVILLDDDEPTPHPKSRRRKRRTTSEESSSESS